MANSANPEINKKIATSALGTLVIATVFFYLGDRYAETLVTYPGQIFDHLSDAFLSMWQTIKDAPFALDMTSNSLLFGGACFLIIWMIWLRYVAFIGNYRSGEESGSARWGTVKEGKKFKDLQTEDNNLLFTKNFGLALHRPKFDPEYDRNLNVLVVGGSGSGKTFNYVTPNICQLNTSYFVTDPKGTLLKDAGYLFTDNGYKLKSFNTINLDESMHYNPLKYVKTDTDILSFVNCFIMNTNPEGKSSGVVIRETKAPTGYVKSDDVSFQKIQENPTTGAVRTYNVPEVAEQVYRSDIEFTKKADNGSEHLAGVPFKVTSLTTGESHIAVTDENGYFSSASSWNAHDSNTNANDWALTASDTIDSTKLDANAGFWFGNNSALDGNGTTSTSDAVKADNKLGALPFDTYSIEELRCSANEGYALINTTVTVTRDAKTIDLGTFDDPEPEIHTTAYDASDSDHYVGVGTVKISDKVEYSHLVAGKTYTVIGELHDAATGDAVTVNGQAITAEKTFTAEDSAGSVTLDYAFDSYDLKGKTLVVYETLTDAKGAKLAEHRNKSDVSQQVTVLTPKLSTSAVGDADNSKSVTAEGDVTVTDYVRYTGLTAGQTYTLTGTLMDKSTKKAFVDADGNPVTATAEFTAEAESGTATVTFTFNASSIKTGTKLIAFETLSTNGIEIADHKDINDIDQTVTVKAPVIGTTAVDAADGDKTVTGEENVAVRDTVHYNNVTPGKTYKVIGTLYEKVLDKNGKVTKKVFKDKDGTPVTAEANFTAEDSYGNVDVTFYFDGSSLKEGTSLVAFESLSYNDNEIASHADVNDSGQTVIITKPKLSTTATDALDGDKNLIGEDNATIVDTVHYMNVTPGKTYKV